ncbi:ABC transporter substrate binding protein [Bradyrhizobium sp. CB2312]|uniref:ABC transporter substrate binding protein n=1 Tax=Bradyrhizobium sp. CB2312 TaxID=3039155 RepID=UPI0024B0806D|nr:ABC transporter substrate binding protein [Bradyrhizobium sp. CB2312]WFU75502.1 ABC transporter substrate binding protein [Bradyrhizobium sp. CB2312]
MAANTTYIRSLRQAGNAVPTVFCFSADPVAEGIVASLARPGENLTGFGLFGPEIFEMLAQAVPSARRIAILWDSTYEQHKVAMPSMEVAAQKLAVTLHSCPPERSRSLIPRSLALPFPLYLVSLPLLLNTLLLLMPQIFKVLIPDQLLL